MELTQEQKAIVSSTGNIKINAVAGSGKTTTVIEYAKARPRSARILYLAFNRSVKLEASRRFTDEGLFNVKVETAHSLAYKHIVIAQGYKVRTQTYKTHEIAELLGLQGNGEKHTEYIVANHVLKFLTYFCNSNKQKVQDLNYLDVVTDKSAKAFVASCYRYIENQARLLLNKMDKGEIEIIHDFYLKKFQLSAPVIPYDYILFDEAQDASPAMLDIFFRQPASKVIVGDTHQQIYGWRHAVNSLEQADFETYGLTESFRFSQDIANLAREVLNWKSIHAEFKPISIYGHGSTAGVKSKAILARTNLGLLLKAIEYVTEKNNVNEIYFEGNINSYTYADDGASLYDVLHLYNRRHSAIKDKLIRSMKDIRDLEEYIKKTEDVQLSMMVEIVKEYGNAIPGIIRKIKEKHVKDNDKSKAEMIFSTVHRCKGMEYDSIQLANDFINEEKLRKIKPEEADHAKLNEEINLLYVAVTRTRNSIHIPEALMPAEFPPASQIHILKSEMPDTVQSVKSEPAWTVSAAREKHAGAYKPWTPELDDELTVMYCEGVNVKDIAKHFGRSKGSIQSRIEKLDLEESYR